MARVPGRDNRIAIPVVVLCLSVVGALVWFALPGVPMVLAWADGAAGNAAVILAATPTPHTVVADEVDLADTDCRELYPNDLWNELTWTTDAILTQSTAPPATTAVDLVAALAPTAMRTCSWGESGGAVLVTTFAAVSPDAAGIAEAALRGGGFACQFADGALTCTTGTDASGEHHALKGGIWVSTVSTSWYPEDYDARVAGHLWG